MQKSRFSPHYWLAYRKMTLVGSRDFGDDRFPWSPCVTCLAPGFDRLVEERHEVVIYAHHWQAKKQRLHLPAHIPIMENVEQDFNKVIDFIASGRIVMSNSYHGVYWALLLGKKVICVPYSNKFYNYRFAPGYSSPEEWTRELSKAKGHDEMLGLCRNGAAAFRARTLPLLE